MNVTVTVPVLLFWVIVEPFTAVQLELNTLLPAAKLNFLKPLCETACVIVYVPPPVTLTQ